jgi:hypothetical protein
MYNTVKSMYNYTYSSGSPLCPVCGCRCGEQSMYKSMYNFIKSMYNNMYKSMYNFTKTNVCQSNTGTAALYSLMSPSMV